MECYFVFDRTSYRTGLDVLKNTQPYEGVSLNFCALQLDGGPIKTSTICFDNSGIDPNHPYVIAKVGPSPEPATYHSFCACNPMGPNEYGAPSLGQPLWCRPIGAPVAIFIPMLTLSITWIVPSLSGKPSQM